MAKRNTKRIADLPPEKQAVIREWNASAQRRRRERMSSDERMDERLRNAVSLLLHHGYTVTRNGGEEA